MCVTGGGDSPGGRGGIHKHLAHQFGGAIKFAVVVVLWGVDVTQQSEGEQYKTPIPKTINNAHSQKLIITDLAKPKSRAPDCNDKPQRKKRICFSWIRDSKNDQL